MLNQTVLVGRLVDIPTIKELENEKKVMKIKLGVSRNFKNEDGEYETDILEVFLFNSIAESTREYCKKGDVIGIKGRVQVNSVGATEIIAEKISFLSSKKVDE